MRENSRTIGKILEMYTLKEFKDKLESYAKRREKKL